MGEEYRMREVCRVDIIHLSVTAPLHSLSITRLICVDCINGPTRSSFQLGLASGEQFEAFIPQLPSPLIALVGGYPKQRF